jgi:hypothetical protein
MLTRWRYLTGLDGRIGLRVTVAERKAGVIRYVAQLLIPTVCSTRHRAFRSAVVVAQEKGVGGLTMLQLMLEAKRKGAFPWT